MKENHTALYPNEEVSRNVGDYCAAHSTKIPTHMSDVHADISVNHPRSGYMISPFQAQFQVWMAKALGAKRILEIGCFIGFSAMGWSEAVGPDGHVTTLEFSPEYAKQATDILAENSVKNVDIIVGDARESLKQLASTITEPFDLIFVDADKTSYPTYLTQILESSSASSKVPLLKPNGVILADNVLRRALVADSSDANPWSKLLRDKNWQEGDMEALRVFNKMMVEDARLETFLLPMFDGVGMARLKA